jgi:hypothetical protein
MSEQLLTSVVTVITAIIGVAILAVLVSKQSNTSNVISAAAKGLSTDLSAALSPITGGGFSVGGIGNGLLTNFGG